MMPESRRNFLSGAAAQVIALAALPYTVLKARAETSAPNDLVVRDADGVLGRTLAPVCARVSLSGKLRRAAIEGRLYVREKTPASAPGLQIPVQVLGNPPGETAMLCWLMPPGSAGARSFALEESVRRADRRMRSGQQPKGGQYEITEQGKPVLVYNYAQVEPGALLESVSEDNRKYAVSRSDYIHPLYGHGGETLTRDWSKDHPHHRGIYWAWPEVDWRGQRADLHALQGIFARPTGRCETREGPVFAQIRAANEWKWADREPIVLEHTTIQVYSASPAVRLIDLIFEFEALGDPVLVARRGATHYGGLNLRLNAVKDQRLSKHSDSPSSPVRRAWSDLSGTFPEGAEASGVGVLQHASNPEYPGDWVEYPELNWLQPTFPANGSRYEIRQGKPLRLGFRLVVHTGSPLAEKMGNDLWDAANAHCSPLRGFSG